VREAATICPRPCDLDLLTLNVVSESRVTWATSVPILVTPLCSRFRPDVCDRQTDVRQHHRLMPPPRGRGHNKNKEGIRRAQTSAKAADPTKFYCWHNYAEMVKILYRHQNMNCLLLVTYPTLQKFHTNLSIS